MKKIVFLVIVVFAFVACNKEVKKDAVTVCEAQKKLLEMYEKNAPYDSIKAQEKKLLDIAMQLGEKYKDDKSESKAKAFEKAYLKCTGTEKMGDFDKKINEAKEKYAKNFVKQEDINAVCNCYAEVEKMKIDKKSDLEISAKELECVTLESQISSKYTDFWEAYNFFSTEVEKCKKK